jgi:hypothetical protein
MGALGKIPGMGRLAGASPGAGMDPAALMAGFGEGTGARGSAVHRARDSDSKKRNKRKQARKSRRKSRRK